MQQVDIDDDKIPPFLAPKARRLYSTIDHITVECPTSTLSSTLQAFQGSKWMSSGARMARACAGTVGLVAADKIGKVGLQKWTHSSEVGCFAEACRQSYVVGKRLWMLVKRLYVSASIDTIQGAKYMWMSSTSLQLTGWAQAQIWEIPQPEATLGGNTVICSNVVWGFQFPWHSGGKVGATHSFGNSRKPVKSEYKFQAWGAATLLALWTVFAAFFAESGPCLTDRTNPLVHQSLKVDGSPEANRHLPECV